MGGEFSYANLVLAADKVRGNGRNKAKYRRLTFHLKNCIYKSFVNRTFTKLMLTHINYFMNRIFSYLLKAFLSVFIVCDLSCNNNDNPGSNSGKTSTTPTEDTSPKILSHSILAAYPHDTSSYTQGLTFYNGELYEGTGLEGRSKLKKVDLTSGKTLKQIELAKNIFGEGIAILRDTIYQLTWKNNVVYVYTLKDFKKVKEYHLNGDGWGLTHDSSRLIVSNGSGDLYYYDPSTFRLLSKSGIMEGSNPTFNLNELEYIDGFVYANQYTYPYILKIDPNAGKVVAKYDMSDMWNRVKMIYADAEVPNGIAYNDATKKLYVTGKWWPELYEVQLGQ
jgi:glutamine cyclotransferase